MKLKYVIIEVDGMELPLVFPPYLSHCDVTTSRSMCVRSAGYCEVDVAGKWSVSGQSVTLWLDSRPEDAGILNSQLGAKAKRPVSQLEAK